MLWYLVKHRDFFCISCYNVLLKEVKHFIRAGLQTERSGFDSRRGQGIFLFIAVSRTALEPTQPPIHWVPRALSLGAK